MVLTGMFTPVIRVMHSRGRGAGVCGGYALAVGDHILFSNVN